MGQQPNIELEQRNLPRPTAHPAPARRWRPERPGEVTSPDDMPWGGAFGTIGPDAGYVLRLIRTTDLVLADGENRHNAEAAIAAVATARSSRFGRAPVREDVELAAVVLGYDTGELPDELVASLQAVLASKPGAGRAQLAPGRRLIER